MKHDELERDFANQDVKYKEVAKAAIERVKTMLNDKHHYTRITKETAKEKRDAARQRKKTLMPP